MMVFGGKGCWQLRSVTFKMDCLGRREFLSSSGLEGDGCVFIICKQFISHWVCYSSQKPVCHVEHTTEARRALWGSPWSQHTVEGSGPGPVCLRDPSQAWRLLYVEKKWWSVIIYRWTYAPEVLKLKTALVYPSLREVRVKRCAKRLQNLPKSPHNRRLVFSRRGTNRSQHFISDSFL